MTEVIFRGLTLRLGASGRPLQPQQRDKKIIQWYISGFRTKFKCNNREKSKGENMAFEDRIWFNLPKFTYKDKFYQSNTTMDICHSGSTEDFKSFYPLQFDIRLRSERTSTNIKLDLHDAEDLLLAIKGIMSDKENIYGGQGASINRRIKDKNLSLAFAKSKEYHENLVSIKILYSESDYKRILLQLERFETIQGMLEEFCDNHGIFSYQYMLVMLSQNTREINKQLHDSVRALPGFIPQVLSSEHSPVPAESPPSDTPLDSTMEELDQFMGEDFSNIDVPEIDSGKIDEKKEIIYKLSPFFEHVLKSDFSVFESMMKASFAVPNPHTSLITTITDSLPTPFNILPGLSDDDRKSLVYFGKMFFAHATKDYIGNQHPFPNTSPILRYIQKDPMTQENKDLALDLLTLLGYIRCYRVKVEEKNSDAMQNGAALYLAMRSFLDPLIFSFLSASDETFIEGAILSRFQSLRGVGFFESYDRAVEQHQCSAITENDINLFTRELLIKIIKKPTQAIDQLHKVFYDNKKMKLPAHHKFDLEQITNQIVPLEIASKFGKDLTSDEVINELMGSTECLPEILDIFRKKPAKSKKKGNEKKEDKRSHVQRYVETNITDVAKGYRDVVSAMVTKLKKKAYEPATIAEFDAYNQFGENIIRALHEWDPTDTDIVYSDWVKKVESSISKDDILTLWRADNGSKHDSSNSGDDSGDWDIDLEL